MPSMPIYFVGKGRQFGLLDQQFGVPNYLTAYRAVLQEIDDPLADLADQHAAGQPGPGRAGLTSGDARHFRDRSEEHTSELQSRPHLVCRLLLEKKKQK